MFWQQISTDGSQIEAPDPWLNHANPWEVPRPDVTYGVRFYGHSERLTDRKAVCRFPPLPYGDHPLMNRRYTSSGAEDRKSSLLPMTFPSPDPTPGTPTTSGYGVSAFSSQDHRVEANFRT